MEKINILGINISNKNKKEVLSDIESFLIDTKEQYFITTPNPEIILQANQEEEFFYILNQADLAILDSIGLKLAALSMGKNIPRTTGADLTKDLLNLAQKKQIKIAIIKPSNSLSSQEEIKKALTTNFPKLKFLILETEKKDIKKFQSEKLSNFKPKIILTTLGAPHQEKLLFYNLKNFPSVRVGIGVGGSLDFITNKISRAPKIVRILGLEWSWRLYKQPWRWKRIGRAVFIFPAKFLYWRFVLPFKYRSNVACLLYKKDKKGYKILVVACQEKELKWQIPQGGVENENLISTGSRELKEELNCDNFKIINFFPDLHKYKFPKSETRTFRHFGYKGQKQGLVIAQFTGKDSDIKLNYWDHKNWQWLDWQKLENTVEPIKKKAIKKFLHKFKQNVINKKNYD